MKGAGLLVAWVGIAACGRIGFDEAAPGAADASGAHDGSSTRDAPSTSTSVRFIQSASHDVGALRTDSAATSGPVAAADLLLVGLSLDGPPPTMVVLSDSLGTQLTTVSNGVAAPLVVYLAYGYANAGGLDTFTVTVNSTPNSYLELQAWEFAGIKSGGFIAAGQAQGQSLARDGVATPSLAVSGTGTDLLFAWGVFATTGTPSTGFTQISDADTDPGAYELVPQPSAPVIATMTMAAGGTNWTIVGATFETE